MITQSRGWLYWLAWVLALGLLSAAMIIGWRRLISPAENTISTGQVNLQPTAIVLPLSGEGAELPTFSKAETRVILRRKAMLNTLIPSRARMEIVEYTVGRYHVRYRSGVDVERSPRRL